MLAYGRTLAPGIKAAAELDYAHWKSESNNAAGNNSGFALVTSFRLDF